MGSLGTTEILIIAAVIILLFGATKLPQMARSLGQSARVFKAEARGMKEDEAAAKQDNVTKSEPQQLPSGEQQSAPTAASAAEETQRNDSKN